MIKKIIKRIFNTFDIDIVRYNNETKHLNFEQILKIKLKKNPVIFDNVYDKHLNFLGIEKLLIPNNFRLEGINLINNNLFSGLLFAVDITYFNKKHYKI